jgi:DNA primase
MESVKDIIKQQIRIEDVIGSYVTLVPMGDNFKACCPFHHEKTPSFNINTQKQMFYCFGCKKGGDVFSFVQEIEHTDFKESLKILAEKAGVDLKNSPEISQELKLKKKLHEIHEYATRFYQLLLTKNDAVINYLVERGIHKETIKKWRIGYAPDEFSQLTKVLQKKGFSEKELILSGLVIQGNRGPYDRFRGRIMFPISDASGKIIGFSGRIMSGTHESTRDGVGKYINSPETILYHKSKALFGFSFAKQSFAEKKSVIIVEGQFDAILVSQTGFPNVVAISGTAGTEHHVEQLSRFVNEIIIATDNDYAGVQSAIKIAELAYQYDREVSVITIPDGKDPADSIKENPETWNVLYHDRKDFISFYIHYVQLQKYSDKETIQLIQQTLFPLLYKLPNAMYQDAQLQKMAHILSVSPESIRTEFQKATIKNTIESTNNLLNSEPQSNIRPNFSPIDEISHIHQHYPESKNWFDIHPEVIEQLGGIQSEKINIQNSAEQSMRYEKFDAVSWDRYLNTLWIRAQQIQIDQEMNALRKEIHNTQDSLAIQHLQEKLLQLSSRKEELNRLLSI